jgi:nucleoside-diphosphate-sugar epimerase
MRYLVTGGAGFIGSNTVDELVRRGHSVVVLDDLSSGKEDNLAEIRNKITFMKGSITDIEVVRKAMHEAEYVLHLAARTSVPRSVKDPIETNKINIDGTLNVLVAARDAKVKRVVFAASSSAYGEKPCSPRPSRPTASPNSSANFTRKPSAAVMDSKMFRSATSTFSARARIPVRHTPAYWRNSA